ncbi:fibronectin type III domain-containing protein [Nitrososphaera sp.]|uniref:fibronectin type III domain-containing protein n=1 Tax=Nitrososphaera sp. TaxID=1971748 RepID=UPI002ED7A41D
MKRYDHHRRLINFSHFIVRMLRYRRTAAELFAVVIMTAIMLAVTSASDIWAQSATPPGAPTNLSVTADATSIRLSWTAPAFDGGSPIIGYKIMRVGYYSDGKTPETCRAQGLTTFVPDTRSTSTSFVDTQVVPLIKHAYLVCAINAAGTGSASNVAGTTFESLFGVTHANYVGNFAPVDFAFDNVGNIYVSLMTDGIAKFDPSGMFLSMFGENKPGVGDAFVGGGGGIAFDSSGNLWATDPGWNQIKRFDSSGAFAAKYGSYGSGNGQFNNPSDIVFDSSGNFYVTDAGNHRVQKFDSNGLFVSSFGGLRPSGSPLSDDYFISPFNISIDGADNIYITASGKLLKFNSDGIFVSRIPAPNSQAAKESYLVAPSAVAFDSSGNLYAIDQSAGGYVIKKFTTSGLLESRFGSEPEDLQKCLMGAIDCETLYFYSPIAIDSSDNIYVVRTQSTITGGVSSGGDTRIQKFAPGELPILASSLPTSPSPPTSQQSSATATIDGKSYSIAATGAAKVTATTIDPNKSVTLSLSSPGEVQLTLPKSMIDGISSVTAGSEELPFTVVESTATETTIKFTVPSGVSSVEIKGATVVPEFGVIAALVFAISLVAVIGFARFRGSSFGLGRF